jgi:hypothetical protein
LWRFLGFEGDVVSHRRQGKEEGRRSLQTPPVVWIFRRQRVNPRAASGGWEKYAATVPEPRNLPPLFRRIPEDVPSNSWSFGVYFVIFILDLIFEFLLFVLHVKKDV